MLIGFILIIVAIFLCGALLFRLSVHAFLLFVAFAAGSVAYRADIGIVASILAAALAAVATITIAHMALGAVRSDFGRAIVGLVFALPAAVAGYHAVHALAVACMPASIWLIAVSLIGSSVIAIASWTGWSRAAR